MAYLFSSSGVTTWHGVCRRAQCAEEMDLLLHTGTFRFVCIYVSALTFSLLSYSMLCCLPDLFLAFWETFGILYMNVLDEAF